MSKLISEKGAEDAFRPGPEELFTEVSITLLEPNPWNPNSVPPSVFNSLVKDLERAGERGNADQPVIVRKHPEEAGRYQIIDGEHRYKAMKELGRENIWIVVKEMDDKEARIKTISMNKFRGEFEQIKLAELIHDLKNTYGVTDGELQEFLGYTPDEVSSYEKLIEFDFESYDEDHLPDAKDEPEILPEVVLTCSVNEKAALDNILQAFKDYGVLYEDPTDQSEAVAIACQYVIEQLKSGSRDETLLQKTQEIIRLGGHSETPEEEIVSDGSAENVDF